MKKKVVKKKIKKLGKTDLKDFLRFRFGKLRIRLRDTGPDWRGNCITSWKKLYWLQGQAGHYIPNGLCKYLTWHEDNVNLQSFEENIWNHGNPVWYREALINKIGEPRVGYLEAHKNILTSWEDYKLFDLVQMYKDKVCNIRNEKSEKVKKEIDEYIKKWEKKMWLTALDNYLLQKS